MSNDVDMTLAERGARYGDFEGHAHITQELKGTMHASPNWPHLKPDQKEALEMAAHKIGRILNGDPNYIDSWHDIIGYTRLVENRLVEEEALHAKAHTPLDLNWPELDGSVAVTAGGTILSHEPVMNTSTGVKGGASPSVTGLEATLAADAARKVEADAKRKAAKDAEAEPCACPGCSLRRAIEAQFPGKIVKLVRLG